MIKLLKKVFETLNERRNKNIEFRKEFKEKTGVDLNDIDIDGGHP